MGHMQAWCKVKFIFTTVDSRYYAGGRTDPSIILADIEKKLPSHIIKSAYEKDKSSSKVSAVYSISYDDSNLPEQEKEGSFAKFIARDPYEELLENDIELIRNLIKKTYGVSKDENNEIEYKIILEDSHAIKI